MPDDKNDSRENGGAQSSHGEKPRRKPGRIWLFRIFTIILVPIVLLGAVEAILRIVGFGYDPAFLSRTTVNGRSVYVPNLDFPRRFFPSGLNRCPEPFEILTEKPAGAYRIFILGASAAQGIPEPSYAFTRILDVLLRDRYPGVDFEVINCAATAINSHVVLEIADDVAKLAPDLFIIYMGNNEVVGPFGPGTVLTPFSPSRTAIRAGLTLRATRLGQGIEALMKSLASRRGPQRWEGMRMFLNQQVRADAPELQTAYDFFDANLREIYAIATGSGAKVIACTVGANLHDCPPFASLNRADLSEEQTALWTDLYQAGIEREEAGNVADPIELYQAAARIDDTFADAQFRLARCLEATDQIEKAIEYYQAARQYDTLRFRADDRINETIRRAAGDFSNRGVHLVDAERMFAENSPHALPGRDLFHEHVHMTFHGNYLLARSIFEQVETMLPERVRHAASSAATLTEDQCAARLAYTRWDARRVTDKLLNAYIKQPPFTNQSYHADTVRRLERELAESDISRDPAALRDCNVTYRTALKFRPDDVRLHLNYAQFLLATSLDDRELQTQLRYCREKRPDDSGWMNAVAIASMERGDNARAEEYFKAALALSPQNNGIRMNYAEVLMRTGRAPAALAEFAEVMRLDPQDPTPYLNRGIAYQRMGKPADAIDDWNHALELEPDFAGAHLALANVLSAQGKTDEAILHYEAVLHTDPQDAAARANYAELLRSLGRLPDALAQFQEALKYDPDNSRTVFQLGLTLKTAGQIPDALQQFRGAMQLDPRWPAPALECAWLLATCADTSVQNPAEAVQIAEEYCPNAACEDPKLLDVLAAAYAALGRFDNAEAATRRAIRYTTSAERENLNERQRRLMLYQTKLPYQPRDGNP